MIDRPFSFEITNAGGYLLNPYDNHITRPRLTCRASMRIQRHLILY